MSSDALLAELEKDREERRAKSIKVVVWDLDNTVWNGVLLEDEAVTLIPGVVDVIQELDHRGILQSISSKNDHATAIAKLHAFGIVDYFLYPQINWGSKAVSVKAIATAINVGIDTIAFIDDQSFETRRGGLLASRSVVCRLGRVRLYLGTE